MLKILFADDSMTAQNMGKKILTDAGYDVIAVSNGAAAAKKILEQPPDIAILDVHMPGYTGFEVCAKIRSAHETSKMPVLLTVGKMEPYSVEDGARVKADGVIIKPFEASVLLATVRNLAERLGPLPPESGSGYDATMRMEPPIFEEFKDDSYNAWKETAQYETLTEAASHTQALPSSPEMANTPAYALDETIAIPPPAHEETPQRETVPMETLSHASSPAHTAAPDYSFLNDTQPIDPGRYTADETQPIHPYVDPVEPPVHQETQEFTAIFAPTESGKISLAPPLHVPEETVAVPSPVEATQATPAFETHDTGKLETFEEFSDDISIEPAPGFEVTAQSAGDIEVTRDPDFEHTGHHGSHIQEAPIGTAPGLVTTGTEAIEIAQVKAAAAAKGETIPEFESLALDPPEPIHEAVATQNIAPAEEKVTAAPAEVPAAEHDHDTESHDAAFEKLVSELLSKEPASAVEITDMPPALEETPAQDKPQSFFSRYLGFGKSPRPERSGTGTGSFVPSRAEEAAQTQPISSELVQRVATPGAPPAPSAITPPPPVAAAPVADDAVISLESFNEKAPLAKTPASRTPEPSRMPETEPGSFSGIREFKKAKTDSPRSGSSVPFTASFEDTPQRKDSPVVAEKPVQAAASSVPAFSASFKEPEVQPRKEAQTHSFEDLSFEPHALPEIFAPEPEITPAPVQTPVETPVVHHQAPIVETLAVAAPVVAAVVAAVLPTPHVAAVPVPTPVIAAPVVPAPVVVPEPEPEPEPLPHIEAAEPLHEEGVHEISAEAMALADSEPEPITAHTTEWPGMAASSVHEVALDEHQESIEAAEPEPEPAAVAEPAVAEHIPAEATVGIGNMADAELAEQLAAALEHHAHSVAVAAIPAATSSNGQSYTVAAHESAAAPSIEASSVAMIITKVLDRMVPEIVRMIAIELEQERNKRPE